MSVKKVTPWETVCPRLPIVLPEGSRTIMPADSLKSQAAQLVEAVAVFRLAPGSDASAGASPSHRSTTSPGNGRSSGAGAPRLLAR